MRRFGGLGVAVYSQKTKSDRSTGSGKHGPSRERWQQITQVPVAQ